MVTNKKATTLRLSDHHQSILDSLASSWSLSKNAVVEKLLDNAHTHKGDVTLPEASNGKHLSHLSSGVTKDKGDVTLKGMDAKAVLLEAKIAWIRVEHRGVGNRGIEPVIWHDGAIWLMGKDSHSQDWLKRLLEFPVELFKEVARRSSQYTLAECKAALERWNELQQLEYINMVRWHLGEDRGFILGAKFFDASSFPGVKLYAEKEIAKHKLALEEDTSSVEPSSDEMVVDADEVPQTPQHSGVAQPIEPVASQLELAFGSTVVDQPLTWTKQKFRKKFGFGYDADGNEAFGKACIKGRAKGWVAEDGSRWFTAADSKDGRWSTEKSVVAAVALV